MVRRIFAKIDPFLLVCIIALSVLAFLNLGNHYLWQDEAENAVIAKNILAYGYPRAYDGSLLVLSEIGYRGNHTWIFQPWLQNYVTAASLFFLGTSTFAARFPFVVFGILSFAISYSLAQRLFGTPVARITGVLLATSVPFLLMIRQARYYSLALLFSLLLVHAYFDYVEKRRYSGIRVCLWSFLLFNANFGLFFPLALGLATHYGIFYFRRENGRRDIVLLCAVCALLAPAFIYFKGWLHRVPLSLDFIAGNIKFYLRSINKYIIPLRFLLVIYGIAALAKRRFAVFSVEKKEIRGLSLILWLFVASVLFMGMAKFRSLRYVIFLIPLCAIAVSFFLAKWMERNRLMPWVFIVLLVTTDLLHSSAADLALRPVSRAAVAIYERLPAGKGASLLEEVAEKAREETREPLAVRSYLFDYLYEITHDYDGPVECIVRYLGDHARSGERVKIQYGDCAVAFYTGLKVDNIMAPGDDPYPEWIIPRDYWTSEAFYASDYFKEIEKRYEKITLDCPDLRWENRPDDLGYHHFRTVTDYPATVTIYRKK